MGEKMYKVAVDSTMNSAKATSKINVMDMLMVNRFILEMNLFLNLDLLVIMMKA